MRGSLCSVSLGRRAVLMEGEWITVPGLHGRVVAVDDGSEIVCPDTYWTRQVGTTDGRTHREMDRLIVEGLCARG